MIELFCLIFLSQPRAAAIQALLEQRKGTHDEDLEKMNNRVSLLEVSHVTAGDGDDSGGGDDFVHQG